MRNAVLKTISEVVRQKPCEAWTLYLDKLSFERNGDAEAKTSALTRAKAIYQNPKSRTHLQESLPFKRWHSALRQQHGKRYRCVTLKNESPMLLHLGRASVLDNVGIYTNRASGVPEIPGSAVKGVLSTWATWEANQQSDGSFPDEAQWCSQRKAFPAGHAKHILGCNSKGGSEHAGAIVFVGAFPKTVPSLGLDIVNPHRNTDGRDKSTLTPNCFLCVEPGAEWDFIFFARPGEPDAEELLDTTSRWLVEALSTQGIGAKTASGYGRFVPLTVGNSSGATSNVGKAAAAVTDYANEATFKNRVLEKLTPNRLQEFEKEIPFLRKPENAEALVKLKEWLASKERKDLRKKLKEKAWFPTDWLPAQP